LHIVETAYFLPFKVNVIKAYDIGRGKAEAQSGLRIEGFAGNIVIREGLGD
jgi:hypothetical protein